MRKVCNFPSISHLNTLAKYVHSTRPGQNIQCTSASSKSVTCSTVKRKRVNSDVNVIRKNTVNVVGDSVIAPVSPRPLSFSDNLTPQCYSERPKQMIGKIVSFIRIALSVITKIIINIEAGKRTVCY